MSIELFRNAKQHDAEAIASLVNLAYRPLEGCGGWTHEFGLVAGDRVSPAQIRDILSQPDALILLGLQGEKIIACMQIERKDECAYLGMLAVLPALQNAGVGKAMLAHAEYYAVNRLRCDHFVLSVLSVRSELIAYYERRGYRRGGQKLEYPLAAGVGMPLQSGLELVVLGKIAD